MGRDVDWGLFVEWTWILRGFLGRLLRCRLRRDLWDIRPGCHYLVECHGLAIFEMGG